ncbi:MAG: geranylgeranyl reductase family protein [Pseudomonadota bacterium]
MKTAEYFDVIIVGSGPAGSSAAKRACDAGLSVAVLDKAKFPRDKLCGGLFTGRSQKALRSIFDRDVTDDLFLTSRHMRFLASGKVLADIPDAPAVHLTMRREFDKMLHDRAVAAGARAFLGVVVTGFDVPASVVTLKSGQTLRYGVLIGADGVNSFVARELYGRAFNPETIGFGLEVEDPLTPERDGAVEVDFDAAQWGYGWSFPKRKTATVGVGGINFRNADMKSNMARYVDQVGADASLRYKGQYLPFGDYRKRPGRGNILLAGDAAGLVDPITGEGIALAMESGALAAEAAQTAILQEKQHAAFPIYRAALKPIHDDLKQARLWRMVMFPDATQAHFKRAFSKRSELQRKYLELLAGEVGYADLRSDLMQRLPKLVWRLATHRLGFSRTS